MEHIAMLIVGAILSVLGLVNISGNISTIHAYNRKRVKQEDIPKYGKAVGAGTLIVGVALIVCGVLTWLNYGNITIYVMIPGIVVGLAFILFGQFKYNKGIF